MHLISQSFVLLFARLVLAAVMLYFGWPKIRDLRANAKDFVNKGFSPGWLWGTIVAVVEFVGGLAMALGVWVGLIAAAFGFQMLVGVFWKRKMGRSFGDYSYDLLALAIAGVLMRFGGGVWQALPMPDGILLAQEEFAVGAVAVAIMAAAASRPRGRS